MDLSPAPHGREQEWTVLAGALADCRARHCLKMVTLEGATAVLLTGLPAVINAPTSTFRWITVPPNGASTRWNDVSSWSR